MSDCPEAFHHGPADAYGRCPWCGRKYTNTQPMPRVGEMTELTDAYGYAYDPDHGALSTEEIRARYRMGMD